MKTAVKFIITALILLSLETKGQPKLLYHSLEISYILLQPADLLSTYRVLDAGGDETNPVFKPIIQNKFATVSVKVALTTVFLYATRRIKRDSPLLATIMLAAANIAYGFIVYHNYSLMR